MFLLGQLVAKARGSWMASVCRSACCLRRLIMILAAVLVQFSGLELIGCTTDGELPSEHGFSEDSAVLCLLAGDDVRIAS